MVLYARYYEQILWFSMLDIMKKRYGSNARYYEKNGRVWYAQYYEQMLWFCMLGIMNKCYGSECSIL